MNIPQLKVGKILVIFPNFQNRACYEEYLKDNKHNSLHLARKYAQIFVLEIIFSSTLIVSLELRSRKTVRFSEQEMSVDKYPSIFSSQIEAIVYL